MCIRDSSLVAYGAAGNQIVQSYRNHANSKANYTTAILNRWTGEGTSNRMPRVTDTNMNISPFPMRMFSAWKSPSSRE